MRFLHTGKGNGLMTLDSRRLWAKSKGPADPMRPSMYLGQHLQDVYQAAIRILDATGDQQLQALGLDPVQYRDRFRRCVLLAAAVHDLGKANDHFQGMLHGTRNVQVNPQGLRHEWVTVLMLQDLKDWLLPAVDGNELDFALVEWAVAGHHPAHHHESPPRSCPPGAGTDLCLHANWGDYGDILGQLNRTFSLSEELPQVRDSISLVGSKNAFLQLTEWSRSALRTWETRLKKSPDARLVAAIKTCLIGADVAGSALPREGEQD